MRRRVMDSESRANAGQHGGDGTTGALCEEDRDLVLMNSEEEQRCGLSIQVGEIAAFESGVGGKNVGQVKAEGQLALEPRLYRVTISRYDFG